MQISAPVKMKVQHSSTWSERLREVRLDAGLSQADFGAAGSVSKRSQIAYEGGQTEPGAEYFTTLAEHGFDVSYVITGRRTFDPDESDRTRLGKARNQVVKAVLDRAGVSADAYSKAIEHAMNGATDEVVGSALDSGTRDTSVAPGGAFVNFQLYDIRAGAGGGSYTDSYPELLREYQFPEELLRQVWRINPAHAGLAIADGPSMEPDIKSGELLIYDRSATTVRSEGLYIFELGEERYLKDLQRLPGRLKVISRNERFEPWYIEGSQLEELRIVGRVIVHGRML